MDQDENAIYVTINSGVKYNYQPFDGGRVYPVPIKFQFEFPKTMKGRLANVNIGDTVKLSGQIYRTDGSTFTMFMHNSRF